MNDKYDIQAVLVVLGINLFNGEYYTVSLEKDKLILPVQILSKNTTISQLIDNLVSLHIDLDVNWVHKQLISYIQDKESLILIHKCTIPLDTKLINAYWIPCIQQLNNPFLSKVFQNKS